MTVNIHAIDALFAEAQKPYNKYRPKPPERGDMTKIDWAAALSKHRQMSVAAEDQFKADLFAAYGITDHPKAERVWHLAEERGHAYGLSEILNEFSEIVDLILPE